MELLVTRQALEVILRGVNDGQRDALEYGGSLLAYEDGGSTLVIYALPTGPSAEQSSARVRTDARFQNAAIARIRRTWPHLAWVGDWHVHPMWLPELSAVDRHTAGEILRSEAVHRSHLVLLLGTAPQGGNAVVVGFTARETGASSVRIDRARLRPVDDDGPEVVRALGEPLRPLAKLLAPRPRTALRAPRRARRHVAPVPVVAAGHRLAPWLLDVLVGWPLRALGEVLGGWSHRPLLDEPLLRKAAPNYNQVAMSSSKIYELRSRTSKPAPEPRGAVVVPVELVEQLRSMDTSGSSLYGTASESNGGSLLRVVGTEPQPGLALLGRGWAMQADVDEGRLDLGALALVVEPAPRATRDGVPIEVMVLDAERYRDRVRALPGAEALLGRTVVLVGLGSVGSDLGARLARLGARVVGCDPDRLAVENLIRWGLPVAMERDVGRTKAEVWTEVLRSTVPKASVEAHAIDVVREAGWFETIVARERPSLLVAATDTADSRRVVNAAAARHSVPALFVALADGAASVRLEVVPDARTGPCHLCAERAEGIAPVGFGGTRRSRTPYASDASPAAVAVAALPVDVGIGTALAARLALLLLSGADIQPWLTHGEQRGNVLFVSLRPDTWVFDEAWDRMVYPVERDPACPVCGDPEADDVV